MRKGAAGLSSSSSQGVSRRRTFHSILRKRGKGTLAKVSQQATFLRKPLFGLFTLIWCSSLPEGPQVVMAGRPEKEFRFRPTNRAKRSERRRSNTARRLPGTLNQENQGRLAGAPC
ncbi:hypothetical protein E5E91_02515 [Deinococcus radiodurans R1 = ATCC 13939 = DSM 20539]|uniref:Uncharacterized protein n=1 Tax=Deinococcus radiodurans (strain ATCC 13939 / DSM 20539 / JCM 16871 / CCUG 27074 / LMG 4051 / NBRC 15346 / NCIMB 9279 / VKM B-1422 / R1) TaxID=243230 RepID=Q9RX26_DEIRA|nr:hypothetical protein DR_0489 [Deinococcus radiodurans R1 = ATCC 13939 = DSM 20539]QEM72438.1 hypothetical protein DXG80_12110 [Deinococcus radiodurans]UDK99671.1 hypothetical protein E5E91_02515 [Deinococcus radiodurans R1 = ATCC 13939 = DSM 20539]HCE64958.1 hypothetical protein [Deinococcus radiodurans]